MNILKKLKRKIAYLIYNKNIRYINDENIRDYFFTLKKDKKPHGISAMLRAKNEESKIELCLHSIYETFDEIVFIDNGSTDSTLAIVKKIKSDLDTQDNKIKILEYPFSIARCGEEHENTSDTSIHSLVYYYNWCSIHSLVYYYNWCLSNARYNYVVKWDADMYLRPSGQKSFRDFLLNIQNTEHRVSVPIQTVYIDSKADAYAADKEINREIQAFPNRPYIRYKKSALWEELKSDFFIPRIVYPDIDIYEIKDTREDEFSHWTNTNFTTARKQTEWENYNLIRQGIIDNNFTRIDL
jgi:glycosyltransferase involved in cell wall biosynthesis